MSQIKTKFIKDNAVTNVKLAQIPAHSYKGNNTGSTANAADITSTQLTADLNLFTSSLQGLVPASGGGTTNFLRADGTFAAPATGSGTVTSVAFSDGSTSPIFSISGSPVTTSGTITETLVNQSANTVFSGPTTGSAAQPAFRALVVADIPALPYASSTLTSAHLFVGNGSNVATDVAASGDLTLANTGAFTFNTVNSNVGSFGSSTAIPSFTVNGKGLITAASTNAVVAPAGTLTGTTLASNVVSSSLTSVGTITSGTWTGTTIAIANGGTGQTSKSAAFDALSPMTTGGDIIYGGASGTGTRLANGSNGQVLTSSGGTSAPTWQSPSAASAAYNVTSQTTTYSASANDFILASGSAFTVTLPTAVGISGQRITIKKTDSSLANVITLNTTSSQTIDGLASGVVKLNTQNESFVLISDNSNWQIEDHKCNTSDSTSVLGTVTYDNAGTVTSSTITLRRVGNTLYGRGSSLSGTSVAAAFAIDLPSGITIDTALLNTASGGEQVGMLTVVNAGGDTFAGGTGGPFPLFFDGSTNNKIFCAKAGTSNQYTKVNGATLVSSGNLFSWELSVPISNWQP